MPDSLELLRNDTPLTTLTAPYTYTWDTRNLVEGSYSLGVRASKGSKTFLGEARTVFVDRTLPRVSLTSNTDTLQAAGNLDLSAEANDSRGVAKVEFFDKNNKVGEDDSSPYTLSLSLSAIDNGTHRYTAKASDQAGNSAETLPLEVLVFIPKRISENLIVNGDAEAGPASPSAGYVSDLPGWPSPGPSSALRFTVVPYGLGSFPSQAEAPVNAGNNFFAGGPDVSPQNLNVPNVPDSTMTSSFQSITLASDWIAALGTNSTFVAFQLSGSFGSIGNLDDTGVLSASFLDAGGKVLKTVGLEAVKAVDRGGKTGFVQRTDFGAVPPLTRSITVTLILIRTTGRFQYNAGLADNLSLVLKSYCVC
jgi:Bacterial Ig domain